MLNPELIKRSARGNRKSQLELYRELYPLLLGICRRFYRNREDCHAHMNTAFLKILDNLGAYHGQGPFEGWCSRIMNNTLIDEWRKNKLYNETFIHRDQGSADIDPVTYNAAESELEYETLLEMLLELPDTTRHVFNLFAIEGYSHAEIAAMMDMSEGTSRWHVNEARTRLKKLILARMNIIPLKQAR